MLPLDDLSPYVPNRDLVSIWFISAAVPVTQKNLSITEILFIDI